MGLHQKLCYGDRSILRGLSELYQRVKVFTRGFESLFGPILSSRPNFFIQLEFRSKMCRYEICMKNWFRPCAKISSTGFSLMINHKPVLTIHFVRWKFRLYFGRRLRFLDRLEDLVSFSACYWSFLESAHLNCNCSIVQHLLQRSLIENQFRMGVKIKVMFQIFPFELFDQHVEYIHGQIQEENIG